MSLPSYHFFIVGSYAMFDETRKCYVYSDACGWIAGKEVRGGNVCMYVSFNNVITVLQTSVGSLS